MEKSNVDQKASKRGSPDSVKRASPSTTSGSLTVRLSEKTRYGLDLLARAQHRSLSQAVEWSMSVAINGYELHSGATLGSLLDDLWALGSGPERSLALFLRQPGLLTFEERATCELVFYSVEASILDKSRPDPASGRRMMEIIRELRGDALDIEKANALSDELNELNKRDELRSSMRASYKDKFYGFVLDNWNAIAGHAATLHEAGKTLRGHLLVRLCGIDSFDEERNPFVGFVSPYMHGQIPGKIGRERTSKDVYAKEK